MQSIIYPYSTRRGIHKYHIYIHLQFHNQLCICAAAATGNGNAPMACTRVNDFRLVILFYSFSPGSILTFIFPFNGFNLFSSVLCDCYIHYSFNLNWFAFSKIVHDMGRSLVAVIEIFSFSWFRFVVL